MMWESAEGLSIEVRWATLPNHQRSLRACTKGVPRPEESKSEATKPEAARDEAVPGCEEDFAPGPR